MLMERVDDFADSVRPRWSSPFRTQPSKSSSLRVGTHSDLVSSGPLTAPGRGETGTPGEERFAAQAGRADADTRFQPASAPSISTIIMTATPPTRRLLGISLKMYFSPAQSVTFAKALLPLTELAASLNLDLFFIPDFLGVALTSTLLRSSPLILGAQDCCEVDFGPRTGEVSAMHLAELGVRMVELGHAERRALYGETNEVNNAFLAVSLDLTDTGPPVCRAQGSHGSSTRPHPPHLHR